MIKERRKAKRFTDSFDGDLMCCDTAYPGMILNLSANGLHFVTATLNRVKDFTKETIVEIFLKAPNVKSLNLVCRVIWFSDKATDHGETFCLGLEIMKPSDEYKNLLASMK